MPARRPPRLTAEVRVDFTAVSGAGATHVRRAQFSTQDRGADPTSCRGPHASSARGGWSRGGGHDAAVVASTSAPYPPGDPWDAGPYLNNGSSSDWHAADAVVVVGGGTSLQLGQAFARRLAGHVIEPGAPPRPRTRTVGGDRERSGPRGSRCAGSAPPASASARMAGCRSRTGASWKAPPARRHGPFPTGDLGAPPRGAVDAPASSPSRRVPHVGEGCTRRRMHGRPASPPLVDDGRILYQVSLGAAGGNGGVCAVAMSPTPGGPWGDAARGAREGIAVEVATLPSATSPAPSRPSPGGERRDTTRDGALRGYRWWARRRESWCTPSAPVKAGASARTMVDRSSSTPPLRGAARCDAADATASARKRNRRIHLTGDRRN